MKSQNFITFLTISAIVGIVGLSAMNNVNAQMIGVSESADKQLYEEITGQHENLKHKLYSVLKCVPTNCEIVDSGNAFIIISYAFNGHEDEVSFDYMPISQAEEIANRD